METEKKRLLSLDLLRGFDLFCLLMFQPILMTWLDIENNPVLAPIARQFTHVEWHGVAFWDLIMPLFMFMSGITIPFAMAKYKRGESLDRKFYKRLLKRFFVLFFLGWIVQGNLLALDARQFHVFANTLQSIAVGYVVSALLYVWCSTRWQITLTGVCFVVYLLIFAIFGHMNYAPESNIAEAVDRAVLGRFRDGVIWQGDTWVFDSSYHYTWILSSLNFIVTVMLGLFAGEILHSKKELGQKLKWLCVTGVVLVAVALALDPVFPIIKRIWSSSMTLFYGGVCFLLMGLFFYIIDMKECRKGFMWLKYYGMNSIAAYCLFEVVNFRSIANSLFYGLEQWLGIYYPLVGECFQAAIVLLIVRWMYNHQIFLKA